ncbi:MAG TPA: hypothetical protein PLG15_03880 [Candidatus Gastranaerophilaceae bacterium]|nr:hypothetical protein [Candidatus Gastranaerophilaceae bacterium]HPT41504.1 hypothetical protein [Candidatus Gastranaerophilaceae bacterium]
MGFAVDKIGAKAPVFKGLEEKEEPKKDKTAYAQSPSIFGQGQPPQTTGTGFMA